eukprot:403373243
MEDVQVDSAPSTKQVQPKTLSQSAQEFFNEDDENQRIIQFNQNQFDTDQQLSRTQNHGNIQGLNRQKIFPPRDFSKAKRIPSLRSDQFIQGNILTSKEKQFLYQYGRKSERFEGQYKQNISRSLLKTGIKEDSPVMFEGNNIDLPESLQDEVVYPPLQQSIMNDSLNQDSIMYEFLQQYKNRENDLQKRLRNNSFVENSEQLNQSIQPMLKSQNRVSNIQGKSQIIKQPSNFQNCNVSNNSGTVIQVNVPKGTQAQQISQANYAQSMQSQTQDQFSQRNILNQVHQTKTPAPTSQPQKQAGLPMPNVFMLTDNQVIARILADIEIMCDSKNCTISDVLFFTLLKKLLRETVAFIQNDDKYDEEKYIIFRFETFARIAHPRKSLFLIDAVLQTFREKFGDVFIPSQHQLGQLANALDKFEKGVNSEMTDENRKIMRACFEINERKIFDGQDLKLMQQAFQLTHKYCKKLNLKIVEI